MLSHLALQKVFIYLSIWIKYKIYLDEQGIDNVMVNELKVLVAEPMLHVPLPPCEEVVHHDDLMALHHQGVHEVGPHEAGAPGNLKTTSTTFSLSSNSTDIADT